MWAAHPDNAYVWVNNVKEPATHIPRFLQGLSSFKSVLKTHFYSMAIY